MRCVMCKAVTNDKVVKYTYSETMCKECQKVMRDMFKRNGLGEFFGGGE